MYLLRFAHGWLTIVFSRPY